MIVQDAEAVSQMFAKLAMQVRDKLKESIVGQDEVIDQLLICALTGSHALIVGAPGLAKTLMVKALAQSLNLKFNRIQFTPDLMPSDITGYELLARSASGDETTMKFRPGPIFANLILADEINRAAPKTQSALLEAMAEHHVTIGGQTYQLDDPFLVVATQNPIEQEGTYPLPEAQLDRFMMEIRVSYPTPAQEREIVLKTTAEPRSLSDSSMTKDDFHQLRKIVRAVPVPDSVVDFAVRLCSGSRPEQDGASPQVKKYVALVLVLEVVNLVLAAKARALLQGRTAPIVGDVQAVALPILRHRVLLNHRAIGDGYSVDQLINSMLG
ncbi:MAG: AAA family ATPase [Pirellulales bacterium]